MSTRTGHTEWTEGISLEKASGTLFNSKGTVYMGNENHEETDDDDDIDDAAVDEILGAHEWCRVKLQFNGLGLSAL